MASADIALLCGLDFQVGCQDKPHGNSDTMYKKSGKSVQKSSEVYHLSIRGDTYWER